MTAVDNYLAALRRLRIAAGSPGYRRIADQSLEPISHTTVGDILKGVRLPPWHTTAHVVITLAYLADDNTAMAEIHDLWVRARMEQGGRDGPPPATEAGPSMEILGVILHEVRDLRLMLDHQRRMLEDLTDNVQRSPPARWSPTTAGADPAL